MKKSKIVTILVASALLTMSLAATSFAALGDKEIDVSVGLSTAPNSAFNTGFNLSVGGGYEMLKIQAIKGSTLQIRGDIGYNRWEDKYNEFGDDITFTRVPVSAGARLYIPIEAVKGLRVYGEASLELSFDEVDRPFNNGFGTFDSRSEVNLGLVPGAGVEFDVAPNIFVRGGLKHHLIEDGYLNASVGVGFKF